MSRFELPQHSCSFLLFVPTSAPSLPLFDAQHKSADLNMNVVVGPYGTVKNRNNMGCRSISVNWLNQVSGHVTLTWWSESETDGTRLREYERAIINYDIFAYNILYNLQSITRISTAVTHLQPYKTNWINCTWDFRTGIIYATIHINLSSRMSRNQWSAIVDNSANMIKIDMNYSETFVIRKSSRSSLDFKMVPLIELMIISYNHGRKITRFKTKLTIACIVKNVKKLCGIFRFFLLFNFSRKIFGG